MSNASSKSLSSSSSSSKPSSSHASPATAAKSGLSKSSTTKSGFKLKILYGEGDEDVVATHAVTIQNAGHHVDTAVGRKGVEEALRRDAFDLVVLGPTLSKNDRHHLPYMVKKFHQGTRVLVMHTDGERHPYVDANLETGRSIDALLEKISGMLAAEHGISQ